MPAIVENAKIVYANGPASQPTEPSKDAIIRLFSLVETVLSSATNGLSIGSAVVFQTRAALYAAAARPANSLGIVYGDSNPSYNGIYVTTGGTGSSAWSLTNLVLPSTFGTQLDGKLDASLAALATLLGSAPDDPVPRDEDRLSIRDSAASFALRQVTWGDLKNAILPIALASPSVSPLIVSEGDTIAWLDGLGFNAAGLVDRISSQISDVVPYEKSSGVAPICKASGQLIAWVDTDGFNAAGLSKRINSYAEPRQSPQTATAPISTDGRSLSRLRSKKALVKRSVVGSKMKIAMGGDSWAEINTLPLELRSMLSEKYTLTGLGFRSAGGGNRLSSSEVFEWTGWTKIDGNETSTFSYGAGPDGQMI